MQKIKKKRKKRQHRFRKGFEEKRCGKCKAWKLLKRFSKDRTKWDGLSSCCKICCSLYRKKWRKANPGKVLEYSRQTYAANPQKDQEKGRRWRKANLEKCREMKHRWYHANLEKARKTNRIIARRRRATTKGRLNAILSIGIWRSLKGSKGGKHWESLVGFTLNKLVQHLKRNMPRGYSWKDYKKGADLHLDHKIPMSVFNFSTTKDPDFTKCWCLKNLQLIPARENQSKGKKLETPFQPSFIFSKIETNS